MDKIIDAIIANGGSLWLLLAYILMKDILPKLFPQIANVLSKRISVEDRLFAIIAENNKTNQELIKVLSGLDHACEGLKEGVGKMEITIGKVELLLESSTTALNVAKKLISD